MSSADNICKQFLVYPDQVQHNVRPDLDLNCLTLTEFLIILSKKAILKNTQLKTKSKKKVKTGMHRPDASIHLLLRKHQIQCCHMLYKLKPYHMAFVRQSLSHKNVDDLNK